jgi:hypothetical protein
MSMDFDEDDVVLVPVRVDRLEAVLRARDGAGAAEAYPVQENLAESLYGPKKDWSETALELLYAESTPTLRQVLDHLAAQGPDQRVSLRQLSEVVFGEGNDLRRISGVLNGLTKNSRKIRGKRGGVWPIYHDPHGKSGGFEYWMDAATAERFREIARRFHP